MARPRAVPAPEFGSAVEKAVKGDGGASLLLIDLDNLMVLNEKGGRGLGDKAIAAAARVLTAKANAEGWTFGRIGGDEFALVAPGVPLEAAFLRAERLRAELAAALRKSIPARFEATATIGVANVPRDAKSAEQLMRKADLARLKALAERKKMKEAVLLREALDDVLRKYDRE